MAVSFDDQPVYHYYVKDSNGSGNPYVQDGMDRKRAERYCQSHLLTGSHLNSVLSIFKKFKNKDITILFGNLGRNPLLLNYLLDFAFTAQESVGVLTPWEGECPYKVKIPLPCLDFLFIVEPYFGVTISKLDHVKHIIVLTSHLNLQYDPSNYAIETVHEGYPPEPLIYSDQQIAQHVYRPPIFHNGKANQIPNQSCIHIDVTNAKSSHEAYLRLLTGKETLVGRPVTIGMSKKAETHINFQIGILRKKVKELGWKKKWVENGYLQEFKNSNCVLLVRN